jgi:SpoIID/LytB domain protein
MARHVVALLILALLAPLAPPHAFAQGPYEAQYTANVPASIGAGMRTTIAVTLRNVGAAAWNAAGANPVRLAYHWEDASGRTVVWEGERTPLPRDVAPNDAVAIAATVLAPERLGQLRLRFAALKEGVTWFPPETTPHTVMLTPPYLASFGPLTAPTFETNGDEAVSVAVTNTGPETWSSTAGSAPVFLSYHWLDSSRRLVVWDGLRTALDAPLLPGATRTLTARVRAPARAGSYALQLQMVREGVGWIPDAASVTATVQAAVFRALYAVGPLPAADPAQSTMLPVTVRNDGNATWNATAPNPVNLSYHWYDASGALVLWEGTRTPLGSDLQPGSSRTLSMALALPPRAGAYTLRVDLVREGHGWFSSLGSPAAVVAVIAPSGFAASYDASTTPASVVVGAEAPATVMLSNTGQRGWPAGGNTPVRLSYHVYDGAGRLLTWDGPRASLPRDVAVGEQIALEIMLRAPLAAGSYTVAYELVIEGVGWFSSLGATARRDTFAAAPGVTLYGRGFGHGVGMSQWGAQGWAQGAAGPPLSAEEIIARYYPGTALASASATTIRVQLSAPSTGCANATVRGSAWVSSSAGVRFANAAGAELARSAAGQTIVVWLSGGALRLSDPTTHAVLWSGPGAVVAHALDGLAPLAVREKGQAYRGTLRFEMEKAAQLRAVNEVGLDDYTRGVVTAEMPRGWHPEALKAQAYAARTYGAAKRAAAPNAAAHVSDDTEDQCYRGASAESASGNAAVAATAGRIITYQGAPITAYYHSTNGGMSDTDGCVFQLWQLASGVFACGGGKPYLAVASDPADLAASDATRANPYRSWSRSLTQAEVDERIDQYDVGSFVALEFTARDASGRVISVRMHGTSGSLDLSGPEFRLAFGLRSMLVWTTPF